MRSAARFVPILVLLSLGSGAPTQAQRAPLSGMDAYIEQARKDWGVAGLAVGVVKDDSLIYARGFGVREMGKPEAVDARTIFAIGSNTKQFSAAAVGMLVDEGRMDWDDPATKHLPGFELFDPYVTREIRMRDLLSHRSGLSRGDYIWYASPYDRAEVVRRVRYLEPSWSFRSRYGYQNIMFIAAGEAVARVAGKSWDDVIRERIFTPLGMTDSRTLLRELEQQSNVAMPHYPRNGRATPIPWRNIDNAGPAGSITSNISDMSKWLRFLLNGGEFEGRRLLSDAAWREIQMPHSITGPGTDSLAPMTNFTLYGLGIAMRDYHGRKVLNHGGGIDGMLSQTAIVPAERLGIVVLTNTEGQSLGPALVNRILDAFLGAAPRDWSALYLARFRAQQLRADSAEAALVRSRVADTRSSLPLERYAGSYEHRMIGPATVTHEGGSLIVRRHDTFTGRLEHWHFDTFRVTWEHPRQGRTMMTFVLDSAGQPAVLRIDGVGDFQRVAASEVAASQ